MEEKERYKLESHNGTFCDFHDTETDEWYTRKDLVTDLINQQDKRIKELEEENNFLEKRNEELIIDRRDFCLERNDIFEENQQLKQQLAEKTLTIEQINKAFIENRSLWKGKYERANQDKISFALYVLKIAQDYIQQYVNDFDDKNDCLCAIDKLIKQLTHQHEDKGENK